jgi:ribonuclease D
MKPELIESSSQMDELLERLSSSKIIAVDTEFFRETTYFPQLALIQIATDTIVACIDPLAFDARLYLKKLFSNPAITKVFHSCSQDLEVLYYYLGETPTNIFDTQIANALLTDHHQIGYAALVENELSVQLDKSQTRTNWLRRPLTAKQIQYAGDDVLYLYQLHTILADKLHQAGRAAWFDEDSARLCSNKNNFLVDEKTLWKRVKGSTKLKRQDLAIVQAVAKWREKMAQQDDKTRRRFMSDDLIIQIALTAPETINALTRLTDDKHNYSDATKLQLLDIITNAQQLPEDSWPDNRFNRLDSKQKPLLKALQQLVNEKAEQLGISSAVLCSRKELEKLILLHDENNDENQTVNTDGTNDPQATMAPPLTDLNILQGWRLHCIGQQLIKTTIAAVLAD